VQKIEKPVVGRLSGITVDSQDPPALAAFWSALLGGEVTEPLPGWRRVALPGGAPVLTLQPVPEPRAGKVRLHLDVTVVDITRAAAEVSDLGGTWKGERHDYPEGVVLTMTDPEGHEFCLVQYY
jgi:predicted enzyme related to lactoylglutathione lyase